MRALAGPAMLLVIIGGYGLYRLGATPDSPPRKFLDSELAGADKDHTGSCYALSTVIVANLAHTSVVASWKPDGEDAWTLSLDELSHGGGVPVHFYQHLTFRQHGDRVRLIEVDASEGQSTEIDANLDALLIAPNERRSTPTDRCREPGAAGYNYRRK